MDLQQITVSGLFGQYDYEVPFTNDASITIIVGANGVGKTTVLNIINALFGTGISRLRRHPFASVRARFSDGRYLDIHRVATSQGNGDVDVVFSLRDATRELHSFSLEDTPSILSALPRSQVNQIEDFIPEIDQIGPSRWFNTETGEQYDEFEIAEAYGEQIQEVFDVAVEDLPDWLTDLRKAVRVRLLRTERLAVESAVSVDQARYVSRRYRTRSADQIRRAVIRYSQDLAERISATTAEYATLSQSLDQSFPARLVASAATEPLSSTALQSRLTAVESRRSELLSVGILAPEQTQPMQFPTANELTTEQTAVLSVYVDDTERKLAVFDRLFQRITALQTILNEKYLNKAVGVKTTGLEVQLSRDVSLPLDLLSSGEQHELVLAYYMLFMLEDESLVLIDEPEISLHVSWQRQLLNDMTRMAESTRSYVVLATHSPQIVDDRLDLTVGPISLE